MKDNETLLQLGLINPPKKGGSGPFADLVCISEVKFIVVVSIRRREDQELSSPTNRLIERINIFSKKPLIVFSGRLYSAFIIIEVLKNENVLVFGKAQNFETSSNTYYPFEFNKNKANWMVLVSVNPNCD